MYKASSFILQLLNFLGSQRLICQKVVATIYYDKVLLFLRVLYSHVHYIWQCCINQSTSSSSNECEGNGEEYVIWILQRSCRGRSIVINLRESDWGDWRNSLKTLVRADILPVLIQKEYLQNLTDALTVIGVQPNTEDSVGDSSFYTCTSVRLLSVGLGFWIVLLNNWTDYTFFN
jgi:hypothetical protein